MPSKRPTDYSVLFVNFQPDQCRLAVSLLIHFIQCTDDIVTAINVLINVDGLQFINVVRDLVLNGVVVLCSNAPLLWKYTLCNSLWE